MLAESRESGGYNFFEAVPSIMNTNIYQLNLTHKNEAIREIFQNRDFRIGLSHAINRQELLDGVVMGLGREATGPFRPGHWANNAAIKGISYDPKRALALLAEIFPAAADPAAERDYREPPGPRGQGSYAREHAAIFEPMRRLFDLVREIGTAVTHGVGAFG